MTKEIENKLKKQFKQTLADVAHIDLNRIDFTPAYFEVDSFIPYKKVILDGKVTDFKITADITGGVDIFLDRNRLMDFVHNWTSWCVNNKKSLENE